MIKQATVLGGGVIGGGWAARLSLNGVNVAVYDTDKQRRAQNQSGAGKRRIRLWPN